MINQKMILKKRLKAFIDKAISIHKDIIDHEDRLNRIRENVEQVYDEIITEGFDRIIKKTDISDIDEDELLKRRKKIEKYSKKIMERRLRKYKKTLT